MENTITENGALYAVQHKLTPRYRATLQERVNANKMIETEELRTESLRFLSNTGWERSRVAVVNG